VAEEELFFILMLTSIIELGTGILVALLQWTVESSNFEKVTACDLIKKINGTEQLNN
jgi:hypothetical protein